MTEDEKQKPQTAAKMVTIDFSQVIKNQFGQPTFMDAAGTIPTTLAHALAQAVALDIASDSNLIPQEKRKLAEISSDYAGYTGPVEVKLGEIKMIRKRLYDALPKITAKRCEELIGPLPGDDEDWR